MPDDAKTNGDSDALIDAITNLLSPLLNAMEALGYVARHLHPPRLAELVASVAEVDPPLRQGLEEFRAMAWPEHLTSFAERMETAAVAVCHGFDNLRAAVEMPDGTFQAYRGIRQNSKAFAALYPIATMLPPINRFFLDDAGRADEALVDKLAGADGGREDVGLMHANNEKGSRGGFSIYVPEYYDPDISYPLIMALHGGSGHGREFLWSWLRAARSRGAILISPTSREATWSLMEPEADSKNIEGILNFAKEHWNVDATRLLMTGMSDGGTFSYVSGLQNTSPFTHLAPMSASFHPMLLEMMDADRIRDLPVYLTHGALDWMFPIDVARTAKQALTAAGADLQYREIADLSHTYPSDENQHIMDWLLRA
ncbi:MAG: dienelactone hydrolase family protein [Alphaproteobacteria bacterium]|jgi:phospholipase/carboxylesterase|nr:dienelactone hydrolase family protein [Alphaproteobacteria bacterium]